MKKLFTVLILLVLTGCYHPAEKVEKKGEFTVEFLFEQNGCKMYRFEDGDRYIYWSDCSGKTQINYTTQTGTVRTTHNIQTITTK